MRGRNGETRAGTGTNGTSRARWRANRAREHGVDMTMTRQSEGGEHRLSYTGSND
jgi:dihydrodipicolinate synthase/N-acetylneuraminate lyase